MELLLIRHGLPQRTRTRDGSPADPSLCAEGHEQARRLAAWLGSEPIDALYSSPLRRARETAAPLAERLGLALRVEPGVVELDHLSSEYVPLEEIKRNDPARWRSLVAEGGLYAGVDLAHFRRQVHAALEGIIGAHRGQRVAVTCHGGVINAFVAQLLDLPDLFVFEPAYTGISRFLAAGSGERSILSLNESPHLRD